ncbi:MAG: type methionyl aminopeptidase, partial [Mucilaginibacter sp.]|nr:type methionyl aminopeptidase [Mucilaginibacter sp.]
MPNVLILNFATDKSLKMSITTENERIGMQQASDAVAITLKKMREFATPG